MTYITKYDRFFYCFHVLMLVLLSMNSLRSQIAWKISYIWCQHVNGLVLPPWLALVNQGEPCREWLVMHGKPLPLPQKCPKTHSPIHLLSLPCFLVAALHFVVLTGNPPFRACLFLPFIAACNPKHSLLSTPLLSIPLLCCGERAKARKVHTGSLECLQAIREMISAVKESLFQGRVNSLFILAFAARRD